MAHAFGYEFCTVGYDSFTWVSIRFWQQKRGQVLSAILSAFTYDQQKRGQVLSAILSAFTYDESGNYSETAHVSATPTADPNPPPSPPTGLEIVNSP